MRSLALRWTFALLLGALILLAVVSFGSAVWEFGKGSLG